MSDSDTNNSLAAKQQAVVEYGPKKIRGVALDMDGLLFDTERLYWEVGDIVLKRRGHRYCEALQQRMMGRIGVAAMQQMVDFFSLPDSPEELLAESDLLYGEMLAAGDVPQMPGVDEWLDLLVRRELPFGLATSSRRKFVDVLLSQVAWKDSLDFILTGDDVRHGKPDPEMYLTAAQRLGIPAQRMLVLEDSGNGCRAAVRSGAVTVAVPSEHTQKQNFDGAALIAETLLDDRLWELVDAGRSRSSRADC